MKVAVIGCGTIANAAHIPSYMNNSQAEIKYFCDIMQKRPKLLWRNTAAALRLPIITKCWLTPEVEAVSVCTPNNVHPQIAIRRLARREKCPVQKNLLPARMQKPWKCRKFSTKQGRC